LTPAAAAPQTDGMPKVFRSLLLFAALAGCATPGTADQPSGRTVVGAAQATSLLETMDLGATNRSSARPVVRYDNIGIAVRTTGTSAGAWSIQYSNDFIPGTDATSSDAKWDTYTLTTTPPAAAGAAQVFGITLDSFEFAWERIKYTYTSGAGSATIVTQLKGS
jgi:hypothetical protein